MNKKFLLGAVVCVVLIAGCKSGKDTSRAQGNPADVVAPPPQPVAEYPVTPAPAASGQYRAVSDPVPTKSVSTSATVSGTKYVVKKGDTLWSIAQRTYGDGKQYKRIQSANPQIQGDKVLVGQSITLP